MPITSSKKAILYFFFDRITGIKRTNTIKREHRLAAFQNTIVYSPNSDTLLIADSKNTVNKNIKLIT
jgi:hypothetical protein